MIVSAQRSTKVTSAFIVMALLLASLMLAHGSVYAQTGTQPAPSPAKSCLCEQVKQGLALLGKYGIPQSALNELVPLLNDTEALKKRLSSFGLSPDKVDALLQEADPLIKAVVASGGVPSQQTLGDKANALLDKYGIPHDALAQLLPLLGDQEALTLQLGKFGLSADKIQGLLQEAAPLIQEGLSSGQIQDFIVQDAQGIFDKYKIPEGKLDEFLALKGDPAKVAAFLKDNGLSSDDQAAFEKDLGPDNKLGLDTNALDYQLGEQATALLGKYKLPPSALGELIPLLTDQNALVAKLGSMGLDQTAIQGLLQEAAPLIQEGLSSGAVDRFLAQQTQDMIDRLGIPEDQAAEFIAASKDPAEMQKFLDQYGITGDEVSQVQQDMKEEADMGVTPQEVGQVGQEQHTEEQQADQSGQSSQ